MFEQIVFYVLAAVLVFAAGMVITVRNPVHAALFLVLAFLNSAGIWLLLEAEFLAVVLVLVYVGAVMVLFLFVIMMLDINLAPLREGFARHLPVGITVAVIVVLELGFVLGAENFGLEVFPAPERHAATYSNTAELGSVLYTVYVYPFEIAAVILLVAIIAAIALTLRRRPGVRTQRPEDQVAVRAKDRVRIVKMAAERRPAENEAAEGE
ncbi:MAG: NADH-quinone oxidoreductase subunit J [Gammaproteobacteria bacterium]|nr:MAG: NADH-quinone oxidoreductase subunit J [Gammaproteobacteria bacterium]